MRPILPLLLLAALPAFAADPVPAITRPAATPQANGVVHTLRPIPEACARIAGAFTGQAVEPYKYAVVRPTPNFQPRARFVVYAQDKPPQTLGLTAHPTIPLPIPPHPTPP